MVFVDGLEKVSCVQCGSTRKLVYHHVSYEPENIIVLCQSCNVKLQNRKGRPINFKSKIVKHIPSKTLSIDDKTFSDFRAMKAEIMVQLREQISDNDAVSLIIAAASQYKENYTTIVRKKQNN